ncbi:alpha/beta hydrolase [Actinomadura macrotermitis]|uniref:Esterase family protein n=1 Tax=Actinomadura macrotermitis TaxID=2585200 RepID=A0A7K0BTE0_9ACTN|nr:alpha/beta hydrolase family protein [Actinomadura macrotermitis]MQY04162.1 hypothetical protein [Actinomadura macrotermitis]
MRKRTDSLVAIGSIAAVVITPAVLLMLPQSDPAPRGLAGDDPAPAALQNGVPVPQPKKASEAPEGQQRSASPLPDPNKKLGTNPTRKTVVKKKKAVFAAADDGAKITEAVWSGKTRVDLTVQSPALGTARKVRVLVPRGWSATATRTWPTVYAFHGGNDSYVSWTRSTDIAAVAARYDTLVAMPEGANGSYTDWYNNGKGGNPRWETFHTSEVRQLLERNFHAGALRAAIGISSGAQGAITYAGRHPGMFKYAAGYSGVLSMLSPGIPSLLMYTNTRPGTDPNKIWGDPSGDRANWVAHDPLSLLPKMRGTRIYVSAGNGQPGPYDKPGRAPWDVRYLSETQVGRATGDFVEQARKLGVPVTANLYGPGSHTWAYWKREMHRTWPAVMQSIGARKL